MGQSRARFFCRQGRRLVFFFSSRPALLHLTSKNTQAVSEIEPKMPERASCGVRGISPGGGLVRRDIVEA